MKFDFLQEGFEGGEVSPSAQGHVTSEAYKTGLRLASNVTPGRAGSAASRAGGHWLADGLNAHTGALDNSPVQHIPVCDSPFGDFTIEISQNTMRFMDRYGVRDWNLYFSDPKLSMFRFDVQDGQNAWGDDKSRTVFLANPGGVGQKSYVLTRGVAGFGPNLIPNSALGGFPVGTNEHWVFSGKLAGDGLVVIVSDGAGTPFATFILGTNTTGAFSLDFNAGAGDFSITLQTLTDTIVSSSVFEMKLQKNATTVVLDLTTTPTNLPLGTERIRADSFWISADSPYKGDFATFWVMFAGGPNNVWAGWCLKWTATQPAIHGGFWAFMQVPTDPDSLALIKGSSTVVVYQDRLFFGNNVAAGRPQVIASRVGFMQAFDAGLTGGVRGVELPRFVFKVVSETYTWLGTEHRINVRDASNLAGPALGSVASVKFHLPAYEPLVSPTELAALLTHGGGSEQDALPAPQLSVAINGLPQKVLPAPYGLISAKLPANPNEDGLASPRWTPGYEVWAVGVDTELQNPTIFVGSAFGGVCYFNDIASSFPAVGDRITFSTIPLAEDPLNLTLASPTGDIAWLNILRGLMLGTTRNEKLFSQEVALVIDPATGQDFQADYESSLGADPALNALDVNDKVLFAQRGRQILRMANISITTSGGLVAEDVGVTGEHLTEARIRSMCFLKSPVQRVVFGFDDGTGAVMSLIGKGVAWSRFTIPSVYGGIYSVAALESNNGSELFVGTENGATLHWASFESKISPQRASFPQAPPLPASKLVFNSETPLPPCMDGWVRCGIRTTAGLHVYGLSSSFIGQNAWIYFNGQLLGPLPVTNFDGNGKGVITLDPAVFRPVVQTVLDATGSYVVWLDAAGVRRPLELYVGLMYPEHRMTTLPLEGGNPAGTSQAKKSRKVQLYVRFVDSYMPLVNGSRPEDRGDGQAMDLLGSRVTDDVSCAELEFQRAAVVDIEMDLPLRFEVAAIFGGVQVSNL